MSHSSHPGILLLSHCWKSTQNVPHVILSPEEQNGDTQKSGVLGQWPCFAWDQRFGSSQSTATVLNTGRHQTVRACGLTPAQAPWPRG